jgi:hypothetical protein
MSAYRKLVFFIGWSLCPEAQIDEGFYVQASRLDALDPLG